MAGPPLGPCKENSCWVTDDVAEGGVAAVVVVVDDGGAIAVEVVVVDPGVNGMAAEQS